MMAVGAAGHCDPAAVTIAEYSAGTVPSLRLPSTPPAKASLETPTTALSAVMMMTPPRPAAAAKPPAAFPLMLRPCEGAAAWDLRPTKPTRRTFRAWCDGVGSDHLGRSNRKGVAQMRSATMDLAGLPASEPGKQ